jgi:hypothetical protein
MQRFRKLLALSAADKLLLLRCLPVVAVTKLGLVILSYRTLKQWIPDRVPAGHATIDQLRRTAWGVRNAARLVPGATCLTQALAAQFLLARAGHRSQIRIGVAKDPDGRFLAHAWLMSDGRVLLGGTSRELQRYTALADLDFGSS